ncbi:protein FAM13A isoform X2 [Conger conger]|uniref:protein FAM13A isoform X2 n=1 Tax=Conger conger TaxID=82655 RepID=UPI002A5A4FE4|nr:protein FAM13A isoform X2 [Conger conger]
MEELTTEVPKPTPRKKKATRSTQLENLDPVEESGTEVLTATPRKKKVRKVRSEEESRALPQPVQSEGLPQLRRPVPRDRNREDVDISSDEVTADRATQGLSSLQESERPISPFYMSSPFSASHRNTDSALFLEWTIRLAVEQHLFASQVGSGSAQSPGLAERSSNVAMTTTQRCPQLKDQDEIQECKDTYERFCESRAQNKNRGTENMASSAVRRGHPEKDSGLSPQSSAMKIQEIPGSRGSRMGDVEGCEEHPGCTQNSSWGDPVPVDSLWQREGMDGEEARVSPPTGGRLMQELLGEDSDPMLSPRSYGYGHCRQYLDDTEVPPSPPNAHSFMSRRRSSSLGSCDEERVELSAAQLSKKINSLKKKINRFEDKFQEERKYRPSHSDKAGNPEVLRWMNELSKMRKELKEHKLLKSEEDLPPVSRPRSNTLPKSFGSQLDRETKEVRKEVKEQEEVEKEPVESTLEAVQKKLQERREEEGRPEDIKDMTREQIGAEKVALQKALLYYENIHGRPVSKAERQIMKPLYDRYRLIKQILCRASTIPIIGSPSSKRRGLLLQPIIEGEPSLFFDEIKEEEEGSEDDGDSQTQSSGTFRPELSMLGFSLAIDELAPSKNSTDTRLSNLHSATMQELVEQLQEAREEKKKIRKNLREFEDQFFRENGRNVQKEDRTPLAQEYNEYKHLKAKLRLLEVLISKRDSSKFI